MTAGWLYIVICAAASVLIAHFLKTAETRKLNTVQVLTVNYLVAAGIAFFSTGYQSFREVETAGAIGVIVLAVFVGVVFIANFFIYSKSVHHNGVGISVAAMRVSLLIPVLVSTLWYMELLNFFQWLGIMFVFVTMFLLLPDKRKMLKEPFSAAWLLVLLFLGTGIGDASLKVFESEYSSILNKEQFMGIVFLTAFVVGMIALTVQKNWVFSKETVFFGVLIGVPNLYTAIFLIEALERIPGGVVYSSVNVLTVLGGTILGVALWGDKLTKLQWTGILFTLVSILLLI